MRLVLRHCWPFLLWTIILLVLTLIPGHAVPEVGIFQLDKLVHVFIFGLLVILTAYGLSKSGITSFLQVAIIYSIGLGALVEVLQLLVPGRSFSLYDIIANVIGVLLGSWLFKNRRLKVKKK